jgi:hypothetical protein
VRLEHRPIVWAPRPETRDRRNRPFKVDYRGTLSLMQREIEHLAGGDVILGICVPEHAIRIDGGIRSDAREPFHPGVEVSFESRHGRLTYSTDVCDRWRDNVRSIALGLEALRAVDRYGVSTRGQQYAGWKALPSSGPSAERGRLLVAEHGTLRAALMATHPDHGGDPLAFADVQAFREQS